MIIKLIKTNYDEGIRILLGKQTCIFRQGEFNVGDTVQFHCYRDGKPVLRELSKEQYTVTMVMTHDTAPLEEGSTLINFKRGA